MVLGMPDERLRELTAECIFVRIFRFMPDIQTSLETFFERVVSKVTALQSDPTHNQQNTRKSTDS